MTDHADDAGAPAPPSSLHQRILADLEQNILTGRWVPGYKIPSEQQLAEYYSCSRMTVNKVVTQLARAGLIQRRRKAGSIVLPQKAQSAILEIYDIREEVRATGHAYRHRILNLRSRAATPSERALLNSPRHASVAEITCLHYSGERPFCLELRLINLDLVPDAKDETFLSLPPGPWLLDHVPWSAAEHRITATGATELEAAHLGIPLGSPIMVVERQTWKLAQSVTHVRLAYPGDSHALTARFTPSQAK